ncbi:MAG: tetratricopeptide repeat protein, partial [Candidatus Aminicenantes bacterium]|nr:tetratricopeptide repeat protein [Candidatus Aminicenantes bacterium]
IDPGLALAHAWLAHFYMEEYGGLVQDQSVMYPMVENSIKKALSLDDTLAVAYSSRGLLRLDMQWDFAGAERDLLKAIELAPGDMMIPLVYEAFLCWSGRADEAVVSLKQRVERRSPVGLESRYVERQAFHYLWAGRYKEALEELSKVPTSGFILNWLWANAKALNGGFIEALATMDKIKDLASKDFGGLFASDYALMLAQAGRSEEALRSLDELVSTLSRKNISTAFEEARVYAGLGDKDKALSLLNRAYESRSNRITFLVSDWALHSLHGDPRFQELARKVGFPELPN